VGRHASRWRWLPSQIQPQYRFPVAIAGIILLAFATLGVAASMFPNSPEASAAPTPVDETTPFGPTGPPAGPGQGPRPGQLIAYYVVPMTAVWDTGFQAQVLITNTATTAQGWQITLLYPPTVTGYVGSWVEGAPQPSVGITGQRFTLTGAAPIAAGQTARLRVEFTTVAGADVDVAECTVNGLPCNRP
jgi:Cellulose binding domain